jgi:hypothetical protein
VLVFLYNSPYPTPNKEGNMKKLVLSTTLGLIFLSLFLTCAFAAIDYDTITMVTGNGTTTVKDGPYIYGVEQPWFFIRFNDAVANDAVAGNSRTTAVWQWDNTTGPDPAPYIKFYDNTQNGIWGTLVDWNTAEKLGNWTIDLSTPLHATSGGVQRYAGSTQFSVALVPELASMILYVLGGFSMVAGFWRKKKA